MDELAQLSLAIDSLMARGPHAFATGDDCLELHRLRQRLDCFVAQASAAFDASGDWATTGARSAKAFLAFSLNAPFGAIGAILDAGKGLRALPATELAWSAGRLTAAHVRLLAEAREVNADAFARDEALLVEKAAGSASSISAG